MLQKIKSWLYRKLAARRLVDRYEYINEVNKLMEEYLTSKILRGGSQEFLTKGRTELANKQSEIRETQSMVDFLKKL